MSRREPTHQELEFDPQESVTGMYAAANRLPALVEKGCGLFLRVSTAVQARDSKGSLAFQERQQQFLRDRGAPTENLRVFDGRGESAAPGANRPVFRQLLEAVRRREIYVVVVSDADRIARNDPDSEALYSALQAIGGLVVVNGDVHDPANPNHRFVLRIRSLIAQFENEQRAFRSLTAKAVLASRLALPIRLPAGLVWGSPDDPEFADRMMEAGMGDLLLPEALRQHSTTVVRDGRRYFVLPYPDVEVATACRLAVKWFMEEGNLPGLQRRIESDPEWPRPGMFPAARSSGFRRAGARPSTREGAGVRSPLRWRKITGSDDGKGQFGYGVLYDWLLCPSVYGTYAARFPGLRRAASTAGTLFRGTLVENAFPGFAAPEDRERVRRLLSHPDRPRIRGAWTGPRPHALSRLTCSHPMPNGRTCGRRLGALYSVHNNGVYHYQSLACSGRGHGLSLPAKIDDEVIRIVEAVFNPKRLAAELDRIRRDGGTSRILIDQMEERLATLNEKAEFENENAFQARRQANPKRVEFHEALKEQALDELAKCERDLELARTYEETSSEITEAEYQEILALAGDLPELLRRVRPLDGKLREAMRELVREVRIRRIGESVYHLDVEFHSGERIGRAVIAREIRATQPVRLLARARLLRWLDPASRATGEAEAEAIDAATALAAELNDHAGPSIATPWTANRVLAAAYLPLDEADEEREGTLETVDELSLRLDLPRSEVLRAGLEGLLGPAAGATDGEVGFRPTGVELHRAFPALAVRFVCQQTGWPSSDIVALRDLRRETGWDITRTASMARRCGGIARTMPVDATHSALTS